MGGQWSRTALVGAAAAMAASSLGACSTGSSSRSLPTTSSSSTKSATGHPSTKATTAVTVPDVKRQVMQLSDLPAGWSVDNFSNSSTSDPSCVKNAQNFKSEEKAKAEASFQDGSSGVPAMDDEVVYMPGKAQSAMSTFRKVMAGCGQVTFTSDGQTFSGTIGQMSFPTFGVETQAYQMNLSTKASGLSITVGFDVIVSRFANDEILVFSYGDLGTPDISQVQQFAEKAAAKVSAA